MKMTCRECGKKFDIAPSAVRKGGGKFCSIKCKAANQQGKSK